jgi:uncharacterized Ntn-hydrolase superfamily protein
VEPNLSRRCHRWRRVLPATIVVTLLMLLLGAGTAGATWSIVGVDPDTGEVGVAVASCVGSEVTVVPVLVPGVGAGASQALISAASGERFLEAMVSGVDAQQVIDAVVAADDQPDDRQFGVVVLEGSGAGWSGADNMDVAIDRRNADQTAASQGNILVGDAVVEAALAAFDASEGTLADRLVAGLVAGADAGGDSRCDDQTATAAALLVAASDDVAYAQTDASVFGVDPEATEVPSVFVSVLVERGGERAPDRLAEAWADADRSADAIVIRQVDEGADTAAGQTGTVVLLILAIGLAAVVIGPVMFIRSRVRRHRSTN